MLCRLCQENKPLRESHIFPEWLYKPLYDNNHRFLVLSTDPNARRHTRPKGIYEKLLCHDCEQKLSKWEGYARNVFYELPLKVVDNNGAIVFSGLQYRPFKLFQMSLIWRASVASRYEAGGVDLGPHAERIRRMLFDDRPGESYEYGSILILPAVSQELMQRCLYPPEKIPGKLDGHSAYRAIFGGLFWFFIVSGHSSRFPHQELFLSKDGDLPIIKIGGPAVGFIQHLASDFVAAGMLGDQKR